MSPTIEEQIERLKHTIADMEAQRDSLGDAVVHESVEPLRRKLVELDRLLEAYKAPQPAQLAQQRKFLTVLFMDIVGSTAMIQHMDPEDASQVIDHSLKRLAQPIGDYGGHVTSFTGDGFMAIFGVPIAREDDPEKAVRAGLDILQRSGEIAHELEKDWSIKGFQVRLGVNTGLVLLGGETEGEDTTKGPAVHLAARVQSCAPAGGMLISHDTYRHIRGVFNVEAWEPVKVKGFDQSVQVYRALSAKPRAFRSYTRGVEGIETRMVGRQSELKYLQDAFMNAVEDKEGQIVTIIGEAGVGKSRLLYEFQNWIDLQPTGVRFYEGKAHQEAQGLPLAMLRDLFEFRFQLQESDAQEAVRGKVESGFCEVLGTGDEGLMRAHILGQWLGFDFSFSSHLKGVLTDPEQLRNRGIMYLGEYFKVLCAQSPVIVFLEDIHWADDSSLDALIWLGERIQHQPLLIVCAARHTLLERRPYWGEGLEFHHRLDLMPLSKRESHQLVGEILKLAEVVPSELFTLVVEGAEGNPFYVEELVKMLVEDGVIVKGDETWEVKPEQLSKIKVPPTLAGVLQARLESLPPNEQRVLQQASVVGRLFWDSVVEHIQAIEGGKPQAVPEALGSLRNREMVYRREASAFSDAREYLFKHDILREVTYESVLKRLRRKYHGLVADWLMAQVAGRIDEFSGLIAGHLMQADRKHEAGLYFLQAGQAALELFANPEAEGYFRQALDLLSADEHRAACLSGLAEALYAKGVSSEVLETIRQSIELYLKLGDYNQAANLYTRLSRVQWLKNYQEAWDACQEGLIRLKEAPGSPGMARLLAEAGRDAHFLSRPTDEVTSLCQRAIDMAEQQGELEARVDAMITLAIRAPTVNESVQLTTKALALSEENKMWSQAIRAYINLGYFTILNYQSAESAIQYTQKAIDLSIRMGDLEQLFFTLWNLVSYMIELGQLDSILERASDILHSSTAPPTRVADALVRVRSMLYLPQGQWEGALEFLTSRREEHRKYNRLQGTANCNFDLANAFLELNRFKGEPRLAEAEAALQENIAISWYGLTSKLLLVVVASRQGRIELAHELLDEAIKRVTQPSRMILVYQLSAEAELARAEGKWDESISKRQALIEIYQAGGFRWLWARQLIDLGDCLAGRNLKGDHGQAQQVYRQSLEMFTDMDAPVYIQVLEDRLGIKRIPPQ